MSEYGFELIEAIGSVPDSPARVNESRRAPFRVGAVQQAWDPDAEAHLASLEEGIRIAASAGAEIICLQELTLSPYFAVTEDGVVEAAAFAEDIPGGSTTAMAKRMPQRPAPASTLRSMKRPTTAGSASTLPSASHLTAVCWPEPASFTSR